MFVENSGHIQDTMFSSIKELPEKLQERLETSWAGVFYREVFMRIKEEAFAILYSEEPSRPNIPVNVLVGLEALKSGFGWSDEEMYDHFCYDVQVRYALGYRDLSEGHFELRTVYNFRKRITKYMQERGENLIEQAFEQMADGQVKAYKVKTDKMRTDSSMIASNIREMTRLQLLVEVLQRVHRMLDEEGKQHYAEAFDSYVKGSSGQYIYRLKGKDIAGNLRRIGELMQRLVKELATDYEQEATYRVLRRVFEEHFIKVETGLRPKEGEELSASSMQSPDDWEATYRKKRGKEYRGYVFNVTETCNPENDLQLIVKIQTEPNNTDDAVMLNEILPSLKERTDVEQMSTDGSYGSPDVDESMRKLKIKQIQSAIRGRKPAQEKLGLHDFDWETDADGQPQNVTCPNAQCVKVSPGRKENRYRALFDAPVCESCSFHAQCPVYPLKQTPAHVLYFSQYDVDLALRRQRCVEARASGQNLRAAVEATVRSIKHPFGNGQVPVRGQPRVSMVMIGAAIMSNVRRICRYQADKRKRARKAEQMNKNENEAGQKRSRFNPSLSDIPSFTFLCSRLLSSLRLLRPFRFTLTCKA